VSKIVIATQPTLVECCDLECCNAGLDDPEAIGVSDVEAVAEDVSPRVYIRIDSSRVRIAACHASASWQGRGVLRC